jgi:hypothetical protein
VQKTTNLIRAMTGLVVLLALLIPAGMARQVLAQNPSAPRAATGLGQLSGLREALRLH